MINNLSTAKQHGMARQFFMNLRICTWNVAGDNYSHKSDKSYSKYDYLLEELSNYNPHFLLLQECSPNLIRYLESNSDYTLVGSATSHCLTVATFVNESFNEILVLNPIEISEAFANRCQESMAYPFVATPFLVSNYLQPFTIVNCHLPPFANGIAKRYVYLKAIVQLYTPWFEKCIIAGDMNMRESETGSILELGVEDAFLKAMAPPKQKFTWNSILNKFNRPMEAQPGFVCRFDRIFLLNFDSINRFELIGNDPVQDFKEYLSDHFGIFVSLSL